MKSHQQRIDHHMNYCQHYGRGKGADMICKAGMDIDAVRIVPVGGDQIKWGPCIEGHLLADPKSHCPKWERRTQESAEKYADEVEASMNRFAVVMPFVNEWRKKLPIGKAEIVECPCCKGKLVLRQASSNGHVWGKCATEGCVSWME